MHSTINVSKETKTTNNLGGRKFFLFNFPTPPFYHSNCAQVSFLCNATCKCNFRCADDNNLTTWQIQAFRVRHHSC